MDFRELFDVFSRRSATAPEPPKPLTDTFRNRVLMRCRDFFGDYGALDKFWKDIHSRLTYQHGSPRLLQRADSQTPYEDALAYLLQCPDANFLDFVEYVFKVPVTYGGYAEKLVPDFNQFLLLDDLPYALTDFVWTKGQKFELGAMRETIRLTAFPQVIRRDSQLLHNTAIRPALELLRDPACLHANAEFLQALEDYRKGDFGDCLTKCGSAFESVLKVVCDKHGWPYAQTDTAGPLLRSVIQRSGMEPFFEQPLVLVATLRNKLSTAHGSGTLQRQASAAKCEYAINSTAAGILLLVKECG